LEYNYTLCDVVDGILIIVRDVENNIEGVVEYCELIVWHDKLPITFNDDKHVIGCDICKN
jgi:hypothetical protein